MTTAHASKLEGTRINLSIALSSLAEAATMAARRLTEHGEGPMGYQFGNAALDVEQLVARLHALEELE